MARELTICYFYGRLKVICSEKSIESLVQTVQIVSHDIVMQFGIAKCASISLNRGKIVKSEGITLPDGTEIKTLEEGDHCKYLGILEADQILTEKMKQKVSS